MRIPNPRPTLAVGRGGILLAVCLLLCACATHSLPPDFTPPGGSRIVADAPFYAQEDYQCGPAALATAMATAGDPVTPDEIAKAIFRPEARGTLNLDMALYPRTRGHATRWFSGTVHDLVSAVDQGRVLVVMVNYGLREVSFDHFLAVTGYAPGGVIVNDGSRRNHLVPWDDFWADWSDAGRWTLEILPKDAK
ncbi:hypothetical protein dsx2_2137 [Desulfovibrio sp. X2]|uniref:C39 family peptidase n=1 Tax=Desulfovibrio sp. X2 TaxID=941449 RepID=UPI0003589AFD|nr:C39 family peptidase [Desulfovibrio sp. X2]EPR43710.1 hypothetical protein dsx2_2137 [Desulfovibrio sp. X2]